MENGGFLPAAAAAKKKIREQPACKAETRARGGKGGARSGGGGRVRRLWGNRKGLAVPPKRGFQRSQKPGPARPFMKNPGIPRTRSRKNTAIVSSWKEPREIDGSLLKRHKNHDVRWTCQFKV